MTEEELARHDSKTLLQLLLSADARCDALTAERDEAWAYMSALQGDLYDAVMIEAERDRLRAALEDIADHDTGATAGLAYTAKIALKGETP